MLLRGAYRRVGMPRNRSRKTQEFLSNVIFTLLFFFNLHPQILTNHCIGSIIIIKRKAVIYLKTILKYLNPYGLRMLLGFVIKVTGTVVELVLPYILSHILMSVVVSQKISEIIYWGIFMIVCAAVACLCNVIANRMAAKVSRDFSENVRHDLFAKTIRLSPAQIDKFTIASLESRITTDTYNIHHFIGMMQRMGVRAPILLIGGTAITLFMDARLALVMLAMLPFIFIIVFFIQKKGVPLYSKVQNSVDKMVRVVREDTQGIRVIKALSKNEYEHKRFDGVNMGLVRDELHAGIVMGSVNPVMTLLMNAGIIGVVALSSFLVNKGFSHPETVIAFMQYFTLISMAMMTVTRIFVMYSKCSASAKRVEEILLCPDELEEYPETAFPKGNTDFFVEFDNVTFSYDGKKPDLENISFTLKKGQKLGIIGATGSGKSTVIKLLLRFYDVQKGSIRINGKNIRTIPRKELYSLFGTVMQNDFLYADTIAENIRFGRDISDDQIVAAAKIAQAHNFIEDAPGGYNRMLSQKATNISGGQKQRLLIARAVAENPEILILDDSSSALDYKTEASLRTALNENLKTTTVINIAQRVSAVKNCDLILVLDDGKIIGSGTHEELLNSCAEYKEISDSQMGGAFVD